MNSSSSGPCICLFIVAFISLMLTLWPPAAPPPGASMNMNPLNRRGAASAFGSRSRTLNPNQTDPNSYSPFGMGRRSVFPFPFMPQAPQATPPSSNSVNIQTFIEHNSTTNEPVDMEAAESNSTVFVVFAAIILTTACIGCILYVIHYFRPDWLRWKSRLSIRWPRKQRHSMQADAFDESIANSPLEWQGRADRLFYELIPSNPKPSPSQPIEKSPIWTRVYGFFASQSHPKDDNSTNHTECANSESEFVDSSRSAPTYQLSHYQNSNTFLSVPSNTHGFMWNKSHHSDNYDPFDEEDNDCGMNSRYYQSGTHHSYQYER